MHTVTRTLGMVGLLLTLVVVVPTAGAETLPVDSRPITSQHSRNATLDPWFQHVLARTKTVAEPVDSRSVLAHTVTAAPATTKPSGFGWADAGIGSAVTLIVLLLIGVAAIVVRHTRQPGADLAGT